MPKKDSTVSCTKASTAEEDKKHGEKLGTIVLTCVFLKKILPHKLVIEDKMNGEKLGTIVLTRVFLKKSCHTNLL